AGGDAVAEGALELRVELEAGALEVGVRLHGGGLGGGGPGQVDVDVEEGEAAVVLEDRVAHVQRRGSQVLVDAEVEVLRAVDVGDAGQQHVVGQVVPLVDGQADQRGLAGAGGAVLVVVGDDDVDVGADVPR